MRHAFASATLWSCLFLFLSTDASMHTSHLLSQQALNWAEVTGTRLVTCYYSDTSGVWSRELAWQSGNTLETLANFVTVVPDTPLRYVFHQTFVKTDMFVGGDCYDDFQWWLLGWVQAYTVDLDINYLHRAADIFELVAGKAWDATKCGGGIQWCPKNAYKNAITNELFLVSSMRLHPYATLLGKPATYYLDWAVREWQWFENSGMINDDYLINDGLSVTDDVCVNNKQTTWTYNQGVVLSGLALLYNATRNATLITVAQNIADATLRQLTYASGILKEPCEPTCDNDQKLFKGIFVRHLGYLLPHLTDPVRIRNYTDFVQQNALSLWENNLCELDGLFGLVWNNESSTRDSCQPARDAATTSAAWDLFMSASKTQGRQRTTTADWTLLGLGNCMDEANSSMSNFFKGGVGERVCRTTAIQDQGAVAYDYRLNCVGIGFCRIRTLSDRQHTPPGWTYENGVARTVTRTNKVPLTSCFLKVNQVVEYK